MRLSKRLVGIFLVIALCFNLIPVVSRVSPAQAAVTWTKYSGNLTLGGEQFVADAWVIKDGATYKMWYTHGKVNQSLTQVMNAIRGLHTTNITDDIANKDLNKLLSDLKDLVPDIISITKDLLSGIRTVIGYATSSDGKTWTVQNSQALAGNSTAIWDSVGTPCVIKDDSTYKMWYTRGRTNLTQAKLQTILTDLRDPAKREAAVLAGISHINS